MHGCFITVEGIEGVGKTTNIDYIESLLAEAGKGTVLTREPGGTQLGEDIRELLLGHKHHGMSDDTELLMMFASRAEHINKIIQPALDKGQWVLCDRFTDASYAYQGGGRGIDADHIAILENWVQGSMRPDLTLLLDVPVEVGLSRANQRSEPDRFESEKLEFFERVRTTYINRAKQDLKRNIIIDANLPLEQVQYQIRTAITHFIRDHSTGSL